MRVFPLGAAWLAFASTALLAADAAKTRELIAIVQSNADLGQRARACQQLTVVGTVEAVPALAALLSDERLAHYAREALEAMPHDEAGEALRATLPRVQGRLQIGVINSLGARRDGRAVEALSGLTSRVPPEVARAATLALGRIATPAALQTLRAELKADASERRAAAAEALLLGVERPGYVQSAERVETYDLVRRATVPLPLRASATRGAILFRRQESLPLLVEHLRSPEESMRDIAIRCVRELPAEHLDAAAFIAELDRLPPATQALLIGAVADRRDASRYRTTLEAKTQAASAEVRIAALAALGRSGGPSSVAALQRAAVWGAGDEQTTAWHSLAHLPVPQVDSALLEALKSAPPPVRVRLVGALGERNASVATPELLRLGQEPDEEVAKAALRSLGVIAKPADLPRLIALAIGVQDDALKTLADRAIVTTSMKVLEPSRRADAVLEAFRQAADPATKAALLRPLGAIIRSMGGSHEVFFAVRPSLKHESPALREAALKFLAEWPDATPATLLLELANQPNAPAGQRETALSSAIRMITQVASGRERSPLNVVAAFMQANRAVRTREEKLMIVSGLGSLKRPEGLALLQPYLDDPAVRTEAALALLQIAPALSAPKDAATLKPLLEKVAASDPDEDTRRKAARFAKGEGLSPAKAKAKAKAAAPARPADLPAGVLFNGTDLAGWDGDPGVWRVREGVIVGGSLEGNPRNEFLATTRPFRNFVLRLDYKLTGTEGFVNGGVQFRSVRITQPPNEMIGYQADIGAGHSGSLYDESRRKKFLARAGETQVRQLERAGDWNRYEIRCEGSRVELTLNGEKTLTFTEDDASVPRDGLVALQIHGNCKAEIAFRNITIEELP